MITFEFFLKSKLSSIFISDYYDFSFSKTTITAGETVEITVSGKNSKKFKGILLQVRPIDQSYSLHGVFSSASSEVKQIQCSNVMGDAIGHNSGADKDSVVIKWTAPAAVGNYQLFATVVESKSVFWSKASIRSLTVSAKSGSFEVTVSVLLVLIGMMVY